MKDSSILSNENVQSGDFLHVSISENAGQQSQSEFINPPVSSGDGILDSGLYNCIYA